MLIKDFLGRERVAYAEDFKYVSITFTAEEWSALLEFFEYRKKSTVLVLFARQRKLFIKNL